MVMRYIRAKLFFLIMLIAAVVTPREYKRFLRDIEEVAEMHGFFDGYRVATKESTHI